MGPTSAFPTVPQPRVPSDRGFRAASRVAAVLSALTLATAAEAQTDADYLARTVAACAQDDVSMASRKVALELAGWETTRSRDELFARYLSASLWEDLGPSSLNREILPRLIAQYASFPDLADPSTQLAFIRRDDPTAALVLSSPRPSQSDCRIITGALPRSLLDLAGLKDRPATMEPETKTYLRGGTVGDKVMLTTITLRISPPGYQHGSIDLRAFATIYISTFSTDPDFADAVMSEAK